MIQFAECVMAIQTIKRQDHRKARPFGNDAPSLNGDRDRSIYLYKENNDNNAMGEPQLFEQSIQINASATTVERCLTDRVLMHRWLNPALRCEPIDEWSTALGSRSRFVMQVPLWQPALKSVVVERTPGLIVWEFSGFFKGRDRWECHPELQGTRLLNRFEFYIPNPIVRFGFHTFAARWTRDDMQAQLRRLKRVAETVQ